MNIIYFLYISVHYERIQINIYRVQKTGITAHATLRNNIIYYI